MASGLGQVWDLLRDLYGAVRTNALPDLAAKIAYYSALSLFPLILVLFALAGILGGPATFQWAMEQLQSIMPREASDYLGGFVYDVVGVSRPEVLSFSLIFLLYSSSGAVVALIESLNVIFSIDESRPVWRRYGLAIASILAGALFYLVGLPAVFAGPELLERIGFSWILARFHWPLVFALLTVILWLAYIRLPNHRQRPAKLVLLVGAVVGTAAWAIVTEGLRLYLANFERFANVYGVVTGMMVLLIWLHLSALAMLLGAQVAATVAQRRADRA